MSNAKNKFRIFLSAAEPSGDAHCAGLMTALKNLSSEIEGGYRTGRKLDVVLKRCCSFSHCSLLNLIDC